MSLRSSGLQRPRWTAPGFVVLAALTLVLTLESAPAAGEVALKSDAEQRQGKPTVKLNHLEFPAMLAAKRYEKFLRKTLAKEVRSVDWGASSDSTIEYRFAVTELSVQREGNALRVRCSASGRLPRGQSAKSQLSFGGDPKQQSQLIERVLSIVARGVISRLAEIERVRRGELSDSHVQAPPQPVD